MNHHELLWESTMNLMMKISRIMDPWMWMLLWGGVTREVVMAAQGSRNKQPAEGGGGNPKKWWQHQRWKWKSWGQLMLVESIMGLEMMEIIAVPD